MKILLGFGLLICLLFTVNAQSPSATWGHHFGGVGDDDIYCLQVDTKGNIYFSGSFADSIVFDTKKGPIRLVSEANEDLYFAKMDVYGKVIWVHQIAGKGDNRGLVMTLDGENNIYLSGIFNGEVDFDISPETYMLKTEIHNDLFFLKTDSTGNIIWAFELDGRSFKNCTSMITDMEGNLYAVGSFHLWVDFMPGIGTYWLSSMVDPREMNFDMYIMKMNKAGRLVWVQHVRSEKNMTGHDIELDRNGNIYVTGRFSGRAQFGQDATNVILTSKGVENGDIFVAKYGSAGAVEWVKSIGGPGLDMSNSIAVDPDGNVVTTGQYVDKIDIDPGPGNSLVTGQGLTDVYIQKLNPNGEFLWGKSFGGKYYDEGKNVFFNSLGDVISVGIFENLINADPGFGTFIMGSDKGRHGYIQQLDKNGNFKWASEIQHIHSCYGILAPNNQIIIYGSFRNEIDADPGKKANVMKSRGGKDFYIVKLFVNEK